MNSLFKLFTTVARGTFYVFRPMARRYRQRKIVECPETGQPAEILVDASPSPTAKPKRKLFSIRDCSLWPKKKGCTESCVK